MKINRQKLMEMVKEVIDDKTGLDPKYIKNVDPKKAKMDKLYATKDLGKVYPLDGWLIMSLSRESPQPIDSEPGSDFKSDTLRSAIFVEDDLAEYKSQKRIMARLKEIASHFIMDDIVVIRVNANGKFFSEEDY